VRRKRYGAWRGRLAGWLQIAVWFAVLWTFARPWRELGGIVDETVRWWFRFTLGGAFVVGCVVGEAARNGSAAAERRTHAERSRRALGPAAAATAMGLVLLRLLGHDDWVGVAVIGLLAYAAGFDLVAAAWPRTLGLAAPANARRARGPVRAWGRPPAGGADSAIE